MIFVLLITKKHNSTKYVGGVMVLILRTLPDDTLYFFYGFKVIEQTRFSY